MTRKTIIFLALNLLATGPVQADPRPSTPPPAEPGRLKPGLTATAIVTPGPLAITPTVVAVPRQGATAPPQSPVSGKPARQARGGTGNRPTH